MTHQEIWVRGSHDKGPGLISERRSECRLSPVFSSCSWLWLRLGCHVEIGCLVSCANGEKVRGS